PLRNQVSKAFARKLTNAKAECKQVKMGLNRVGVKIRNS
ncbi:MAG: hypothetical protein RLZZ382_606, partial [Bacteroidota bacterium]